MRRKACTARVAIGALTVLSWGLLTLAIVAWGRTTWVADQWSYQSLAKTDSEHVVLTNVVITSIDGSIMVARYAVRTEKSLIESQREFATPRIGWAYRSNPAAGTVFSTGRFRWGSGDWAGDSRGPYTEVVVPWWLIGLLGLPLAARSAHRLRGNLVRGHRRAAGLCVACGYDLSRTPDRCPECGTTAEPPRTATASSGAVE
jgi:hypothetical protein